MRAAEKSYIIFDWAGNRKLSLNGFPTFEDAWDFIYATLPDASDEDLGEFYVDKLKRAPTVQMEKA